jgi:hypothetical protein
MARSRNIKPGFFTNDTLAELPALTRLLFIGMWTLADRDGRIEDRPKRIKAECMPYDDMDIDAALNALAAAGFVLRYEVGGTRCIQIVNWAKHQNPHVKEQASSLPAPDMHGASTVQAPDKPDECTEQAGLIPDSGFLIPDSSSSVPNGTGVPPTATEVVFTFGVSLLTEAGQSEVNARRLLGQFRKTRSDDDIAEALRRCAQAQAIDPVAWLKRTLDSGPAPPAKPVETYRDRAARERMEQFAPGAAVKVKPVKPVEFVEVIDGNARRLG